MILSSSKLQSISGSDTIPCGCVLCVRQCCGACRPQPQPDVACLDGCSWRLVASNSKRLQHCLVGLSLSDRMCWTRHKRPWCMRRYHRRYIWAVVAVHSLTSPKARSRPLPVKPFRVSASSTLAQTFTHFRTFHHREKVRKKVVSYDHDCAQKFGTTTSDPKNTKRRGKVSLVHGLTRKA